MKHIWKNQALLGLATFATLGLAAAQPAMAQTLTGFGTGFAAPNGDTMDVPATIASLSPDNSTLTLTNGAGHSAGSIWTSAKQNIGAWNTSFDYQSELGAGATVKADGFTFTMQDSGTTALGGYGGDLGYATGGGGNGAGIFPAGTTSASVQFNIYTGNPPTIPNSTGFGINGINGKAQNPLATSILSSGDLIHVALSYSNTNNWLTETLTDQTNPVTYTQSYYANLGGLFSAGSGQAYVGFTGGSGGQSATQTISNFTFTGATAVAQANPAPIAVTGFDSSAIQDSPTRTVKPIDGSGQYAFYTVNDNSAGGGLPENGTIVSAGASSGGTFQLASYTGNNALLLSNNPSINSGTNSNPVVTYNYNSSGTLKLSAPGNYSTIGVLSAAASGPAPVSVTFNYSDGTTTVSSLSVQDWFFPKVTPAIGAGRISIGTQNSPTGGTQFGVNGPYLYENYFQVDPTKTLYSIDFLDTKAGITGTTVAGIFGINGIAAAPEPAETVALMLGAFGLLGLIAKKRRANG